MFTNAQLKKLIIPLLVEQALAVLVGMADTVMVSFLGEAGGIRCIPGGHGERHTNKCLCRFGNRRRSCVRTDVGRTETP